MRTVVCEICETQYPASAARCPVCGTSREYSAEAVSYPDDGILLDIPAEAPPAYPRRKQKEIFDFDEVNMDDDEDEDEDVDFEEEEDDFEDEPKSNTLIVIVLVILIALLLLAVGFMFFRFFLPNMRGSEETTAPVVTTAPVETEIVTEPTEFTVPCTDLSIPGGKAELSQEGQFFLLNVQVFPQNTTDELVFQSEDEGIAVVDADGRITAVGEGQTSILITCGRMQLKYSVVVDYSLGEEPVQEETVPAVTLGEEETQADEENTGETDGTDSTEPEQTEAADGSVLKLKKTDITLFVRYTSYQLELDCDIPADQIKWVSMDSGKAIVNNGLVTATGPGTTKIVASYGDQSVECIVRCNFS